MSTESNHLSRWRVSKLVSQAKENRKNRVYYDKYFKIVDIRRAGLVQDKEKTKLEHVQLDENRNEFINLFGLNELGSYFSLRISVASLYTDSQQTTRESTWRNAQVELVYWDHEHRTKYSYTDEQLLDYAIKRSDPDKHDNKSIYKIGSLSLEIVSPFTFARIVFTGFLNKSTPEGNGQADTRPIPMKLTISTHPTCDKFDYQFRFTKKHASRMLTDNVTATTSPSKVFNLLLEDRIDQPLMFQCHLEPLDASGGDEQYGRDVILWGARVKKFLKPLEQLDGPSTESNRDTPREHLFVWVESGQQIHLTRPVGFPKLVYGMVHNGFDYASPVSDVKVTSTDAAEGQKETNLLGQLKSFNELSQGRHKISLKSFKFKDYTIEFKKTDVSPSNEELLKVSVNGFDGWALRTLENLGQFIRQAQLKRLFVLAIHDNSTGFNHLASEQLLGGKGNSLINLMRLTSRINIGAVHSNRISQVGFVNQRNSIVRVSVPRGVIVSCQAYRYWLASNPLILKTIDELDRVRRVLSAKSIYTNPLSSEYVPIGQSKQILEEQCRKSGLLLRSCPLPDQLAKKLTADLVVIFGKDSLRNEEDEDVENGNATEAQKSGIRFAVRSSAMGEDSLETSAAGQMKTILGARGLSAIFKSIIECWASQFELEAVTYKTQNGLAFNLPMAVVVQELIDCHAAGVAATCNPINGDMRQLEITANLGLGEGVVSGRQTDTVRVSLNHDNDSTSKGYSIEKLGDSCCLEDGQIIALGNLLLELRNESSIKEREVEWGITKVGKEVSSSSSSSSSSSDSECETFQIHLLQSRPLTNLARLSTAEIDHELDYGFGSPIDLVSRANLAEVMPGAFCAINGSYFQPITTSYATHKPFEKNHSRQSFAADAFGYYSNMAVMVYTYSDTIKRFSGQGETDVALFKAILYTMLGSVVDKPDDEEFEEKLKLLQREKLNPLSKNVRRSAGEFFMLDAGFLQAMIIKAKRDIRTVKLHENLISLESLIDSFEREQAAKTSQLCEKCSKEVLKKQIKLVFERLTSNTGALAKSWMCHINATLISMIFNITCLKLLSEQPNYPHDVTSPEILNDFSILMRSPSKDNKLGKQTESGDISKLLSWLIETFIEENELEKVKSFSHKELYNYLDNSHSSSGSSHLYRDFMERNGHRAYKEFCLGTKAWSDDPSYIIRSLSVRLKQFSKEEMDRERERVAQLEREHETKLAEVESKITNKRFILLKYALPRARTATIRREETKSLMVKAIHKHRLAFRHLGGLLCLAGCLPSADIIFNLTIDELNKIVSDITSEKVNIDRVTDCLLPERTGDLSRLIYKARRRQQRTKAFDQVNFARPTLRFYDMVETIREQVGTKSSASSIKANGLQGQQEAAAQSGSMVKGLTSCGGCVTGRACVVSTIEEMDQLIEQNDILITHSIDISWSVYFFALSGIVTEAGGIVSHGAVVAREYGIPTLCTAIGACSEFKTGQMITLDADKGICYPAGTKEQLEQNGDAKQ